MEESQSPAPGPSLNIYIERKFIFGHAGSLFLAWAFSGCSKRGYSSLQWAGFSLQRLLSLRSTSSRVGAQHCGTRA